MNKPVISNPWGALRAHTPARIALGRSGISLPTAPHLAFQLDHARARRAVHHALDMPALEGALAPLGQEIIVLESAADTRAIYLQRPDLGRRLSDRSRLELAQHAPPDGQDPDLAIVIGDGLSALAIEENAPGFLSIMLPVLAQAGLRLAPIVLAREARVAIGDEIGAGLRARQVIVLIGERPGLSSPDSMGIYFTHAPQAGLTDAARNCISNVRRAGLSWQGAAHKLWFLIQEARRRNLSGVDLKDEAEILAGPGGNAGFLLGH
ncbi:ethanolamine ammonia-lyase subunit EutC [Xinfangfangia sp. D13-10-4-6]|uniref:ethanolamine ammonia-lyase subunit EutC n=1 Tax=Pseudogemmobacter hezensis TaxID=2737662 RepID=UPI001554BA32|nr:ethanolamine ammonia-lyase subunit EutC [Pseudogemmobacter hezensis]NPD14889.1 ethanolamine ammonia-lyase subunit EutC [Pseudogemmobacter hezensis]